MGFVSVLSNLKQVVVN